MRIYKTCGIDAVQVISENPYRLARDIRGIGFLTVDRVAEKLSIEKTAMIRVRAGLGYALAEAMDEDAVLRQKNGTKTPATVHDISCGGISLECDLQLDRGTDVAIVLADMDQPLDGRIVRSGDGNVAVIYRQDAETMARADQAFQAVCRGTNRVLAA